MLDTLKLASRPIFVPLSLQHSDYCTSTAFLCNIRLLYRFPCNFQSLLRFFWYRYPCNIRHLLHSVLVHPASSIPSFSISRSLSPTLQAAFKFVSHFVALRKLESYPNCSSFSFWTFTANCVPSLISCIFPHYPFASKAWWNILFQCCCQLIALIWPSIDWWHVNTPHLCSQTMWWEISKKQNIA